ncbi:MAG: SDR family NAD(P)-dependent oxidoreductase [Clostridia bacterium]|nr:SDR family NAD(P)-dependent oxidoreductase [Clostridia bacterium]
MDQKQLSYASWLRRQGCIAKHKLAVITGANSGIGFATAQHLLSLGACVILACRSKERGITALQQLRAAYPKSKIALMLVDLASFASMDGFVAKIKERYQKIDLLIHCAGVYYPKEGQTADGLPATVGINYIGTVKLTEELLPLLGRDGRVVFTTSLVDRFGKVGRSAPRAKEGYREYAESKLLLSAYALQKATQRGEKQPRFVAAHPGITATSLLDPSKTTHHPLFSKLGHGALYLVTHSKEKAALTVAYAACGPVKNGACIGPRGIFGISGYPHATHFCHNVTRQAKEQKPYIWEL